MHITIHRRRLTVAAIAAILLLAPASGWASPASPGSAAPDAGSSPAWTRVASWLPAWVEDMARALGVSMPTQDGRSAVAAIQLGAPNPGAGPEACEGLVCTEAGPDLDPDG